MLYAINFIETGEILTPESFKEYWKNYGGNSLHGWRPPKKIYYTLGRAKGGFAYIPEQLKPLLEISEFTKSKSLILGSDLMVTQKEKREAKLEEKKVRIAKAELERAENRLKQAQADLQRLKQ
jgi:hypothetical protein